MTITSRNTGVPDPIALETGIAPGPTVVIAALAAVIAVAWIWLILGDYTGMSTIGMTGNASAITMGSIGGAGAMGAMKRG